MVYPKPSTVAIAMWHDLKALCLCQVWAASGQSWPMAAAWMCGMVNGVLDVGWGVFTQEMGGVAGIYQGPNHEKRNIGR